ncbi:MAG: glycoside hydrolase family 28 protein [Spirochaetaceae bacterium]|jgi:polygalacturonase|nr:glycoside hydrolase family 28 protein [Spirochaetaceae bacterium]
MTDIDIASFGALGDGLTDNSAAFAAALNALRESGGGTLTIGKGVWRTGPIRVFSHTTLAVEEGAEISFIPEIERYAPVFTRWEGVECYGMHPLVFADGERGAAVVGKGVLNGNGQVWWDILRDKRRRDQTRPETPLEMRLAALNPGSSGQPSGGGGRNTQFLRPPLIQFYKCADIRVEDITLVNSPFWTLHPVFCDRLAVRNVRISNPPDAPNTDGIDIDSCRDVMVEGCHVGVGDDGIVLKSGSGEDGLRVNAPTSNVAVRNCTVKDGHGGIVIGSETAGGIFDVLVEDCVFAGTDRGIRIKTRRGRGGRIRNLSFRRLTMENNLCPLVINMFYRCGAALSDGFFTQDPLQAGLTTPSIKNVAISRIRASRCRASAGFIAGLPEAPIENLTIRSCEFVTDETSPARPDESDMFLGPPPVEGKGFRVLNVKNPDFSDITVTGPREAFIYG